MRSVVHNKRMFNAYMAQTHKHTNIHINQELIMKIEKRGKDYI